ALSVRDATTTQRVTDGLMQIANVLSVDNGELLHTGQQAYDTLANNVESAAGSAASLFNLLPTDPSDAGQFDWSPAANAPQRTGGMTTRPAAIAGEAGTFVTATGYRGAAAPAGPTWWEGWTTYADNWRPAVARRDSRTAGPERRDLVPPFESGAFRHDPYPQENR